MLRAGRQSLVEGATKFDRRRLVDGHEDAVDARRVPQRHDAALGERRTNGSAKVDERRHNGCDHERARRPTPPEQALCRVLILGTGH